MSNQKEYRKPAWEKKYEELINTNFDEVPEGKNYNEDGTVNEEHLNEVKKLQKLKSQKERLPLDQVGRLISNRDALREELKKLKDEAKKSSNLKSQLDKKTKEKEKLDKELKELQDKKKELKDKISQIESSNKKDGLDKAKEDLDKVNENLKKNQESYSKVSNEITLLNGNEKINSEDLDKQIYEKQTKISKINLVCNNLMNGKSWDDIAVALEGWKDRKFVKSDKKEVEEEKDESEARNINEKGIDEDLVSSLTSQVQQMIKDDEEKQGFDSIFKDEDIDSIFKDEDREEEGENSLIERKSTFAERHPRIAKFFNKIKSFFIRKEENLIAPDEIGDMEDVIIRKKAERIQDSQQKSSETEIEKTVEKVQPENTEKDIINDNKSKKEKFLNELREFQEMANPELKKERLEQTLKENKEKAANEYATKFGGKYNQQDGANIEAENDGEDR